MQLAFAVVFPLLIFSRLAEASATASHLCSVPLQKQYVPVVRAGKTVAYKTAFFGSVSVGHQESQQVFTVVFDTGSGHFILPSTSCNSETCLKHRRYNRTSSRSAVDIESDGTPLRADATERDNVAIGFGTGEVLGEFVREVVCMGGGGAAVETLAEGAQATVEAPSALPDSGVGAERCVSLHAVVATEMTEDPFGLFAFDGVLGLSLDALALNPQFSFFKQMAEQHPAMSPSFAVFLARTDDGESVITLGGHDTRLAASEIEWAPVALKELGYWQVQLKAVRIGDLPLEDCADGSCRAILDTGTSLLGVPRQSARGLHKMLARPVPEDSNQAAADIDCRSVPGQTITFELADGPALTLGVEDYSRPTPFNMTVGAAESGQSRLICRSLLLPVDMQAPLGPKVFIWGEPMLRRYYTVYDLGTKQVGFAMAQEPTAAVASGGGRSGLPAVGAPPPGSLLSGAPLAPLPPGYPSVA